VVEIAVVEGEVVVVLVRELVVDVVVELCDVVGGD